VTGALAALVLAAARRSGGEGLRLAGAGPSGALARDLEPAGAPRVALAFGVRLDGETFAARVVLARAVLASADLAPWSREALARLGPTPLTIPVVASTCRATVADIAALGLGDVFLPGAWRVTRAKDGGWSGRVLLAPPAGSLGLAADVSGAAGVVLVGDPEPVDAAEALMDGGDRDALVTAMGEVPVVVRVEVGEATLPAREWAALGRGDVIALGRRIGEKVVLRIGGVAVARGELVEIDGELGVRVAERVAAGP
jgi:type III secretion system YscQ/HrcQ family protein